MFSRLMAVAIFVLSFWFIPYSAAFGQSFDCRKARLAAEKTICSGQWLSKMDIRLNEAFGRLRSSKPAGRQRRGLIRAQRNWLRARNQCKSNRRCLRSQYDDRLAEIEGQLDQRGRRLALEHPGPSFDCGVGRGAAEVTICGHRHISNLDRRLSGIFTDALRKSRSNADRRDLRFDRARWIKVRNACRYNRACLRRSYNSRISELNDVILDLVSRPVSKPSFNCAFAKLMAEHAICRSSRLAKLDVENNELYERALKQAPSRRINSDLRASEKDWQSRRNACRGDRQCLTNSYMGRIVDLENILYYFSSIPKKASWGPSFDCLSNRSRTEQAICGRKNLSRLDRQLALLYGNLKKELPKGARDGLRLEQLGWITERNACGADVRCLRRRYRNRISELEGQLDELKNQNWKRRVKVSPSFNCKYARKPAETAICDNGILAQLDREMATTYYALREATKNTRQRAQIKYRQKAWLVQRNNCGYRVNCLRDQYEARLYQLERALGG